ncbi:unnamed protein product, partial [Gongylonema pulchrum]|uniref:CULLIN_2 domain-containing protein n=1 Tax=Gongylonema pulchrum TaxID=637853 RepID=A0A183DIZ0_9BILA
DEKHKEQFRVYAPVCRTVYGVTVQARVKRDKPHEHQQHTLESYFETHLKWLTDEQKAEIKRMKEEGQTKFMIQEKIFQYFEELRREEKLGFAEYLQEVCRELVGDIVGNKRATVLTRMRNAGATLEEIKTEMEIMLDENTDKTVKAKIEVYGAVCGKIFGVDVPFRRRRDEQGQHTLDDYFKTHLSWLADAQKEEIKKMKEDGKTKADMQDKIMRYYDALNDGEKAHATELLLDGCREVLKDVVGEEHYNDLKKMKDAGAGVYDLKAKVDAILEGITDVQKREKIKLYGAGCRKIFAAAHYEHSLEDYFKGHLKWLTDEQRNELRKMKEENKSKIDIREKIYMYYEELNDTESKSEAGKFLREACRDLFRYVVGDEKADELKKLKESGVSLDEMKHKVDLMIA